MPSDRLRDSLNDILAAISLIQEWTDETGGVENALRANSMSNSAIERQLLIISEAAIRIHHVEPSYLEVGAPEVDWPGVRGVGNFIRHRYSQIDAAIIERILREYLEPLKAACRRLLAQP